MAKPPKKRKKHPKQEGAAQNDFITLTSHQLRTPLSGMKWLLELFAKKQHRQTQQKTKRILG